MSSWWRWPDCDRVRLAELLPEALVVLPVGATEQHGPHLPTGTDAWLVGAVTERAVAVASDRSGRPLVLVPAMPFGASDHHLRYGATLSLTAETMLAVLLDLARSVARAGGRRLVLVNGHGGNTGVCHATAAAAAARHELAVACADYWDAFTDSDDEGVPVPGHAGEFETALVLALRPELVADRQTRPRPPELPAVPDFAIHSGQIWRDIDGYSDRPDRADPDRGKIWLERCVVGLADRLVDLAGAL